MGLFLNFDGQRYKGYEPIVGDRVVWLSNYLGILVLLDVAKIVRGNQFFSAAYVVLQAARKASDV